MAGVTVIPGVYVRGWFLVKIWLLHCPWLNKVVEHGSADNCSNCRSLYFFSILFCSLLNCGRRSKGSRLVPLDNQNRHRNRSPPFQWWRKTCVVAVVPIYGLGKKVPKRSVAKQSKRTSGAKHTQKGSFSPTKTWTPKMGTISYAAVQQMPKWTAHRRRCGISRLELPGFIASIKVDK